MYSTKTVENWGLVPENIASKYNIVKHSLEDSYNECLEWMAVHSKSFYFASRFLPQEQRKSVAALYAFCRLADDIVDEAPEGTTIEEINVELDKLKTTASQLVSGYTSTLPILQAFRDTIRKHNIPLKYIHELIEGVRMDLTKKEYQTDEELDLYMYRVASTVGLMMTHIFMENPAPHTLARAADLGKAMQLTNILRDVKEDYERGRIYLPKFTCDTYNVTEADFQKDEVRENLKSLIRYESTRAKGYYKQADLGIEELPPAAAYTVKVASRVYGEILNEIRRRDYQILKQRAVVSKFRKILLASKVRLEYLRKIKPTTN
ncbi:MAG: phytoene/squalene synthase family protein [Candidatus Heimdallarchaeota archaeon]|nr:MAG: phytoene/squalene synthase family protein [Candidatus Heimdallarchaeota archaeon]